MAFRTSRAAALLAATIAFAASSPALANDAAHPTVVELYQSQGCSSCPPAIANVNAIAGRPDVLALIFAVTYWDQLGWKDTFARPEFTARQREFAKAGQGYVATPQTIVNGRVATNGGDRAQLVAAIRAGDRGLAVRASRHRAERRSSAAAPPPGRRQSGSCVTIRVRCRSRFVPERMAAARSSTATWSAR